MTAKEANEKTKYYLSEKYLDERQDDIIKGLIHIIDERISYAIQKGHFYFYYTFSDVDFGWFELTEEDKFRFEKNKEKIVEHYKSLGYNCHSLKDFGNIVYYINWENV